MRYFKVFLAATAASASVAGVIATPAAAQQITSGVQGRVVDDAGNAISNASVAVTDTRTGSTRQLVTGSDGSFRAGNLVTGGPYTVTATASGFEGQTVENIRINLSGDTSLAFELTRSAGEATIVVTAARANLVQLALGPGNSFNEEVLESFPSITRDVRDLIRIDPRVSLDRSNEVDRISCLGGNDRSNTFTVDGIVQADVFGLNGTPFAARNALPLPFDAIRETSIEFAPFDVEYSGFTGCAVNVVTQSGSNRFSGSAFYTFRNEDLRGDTIDGQDFTPAAFEEKRWGVTLGGPIIPDRLFFFGAYEETDLGDTNDTGPAGGGFPNDADFVTQAQFDQFSNIAQNVYGIDIGGYPRSLPESSVRYFGRLDWYVNDDHRVEATYQRLEETNVESDTGDQELTGLNSFEDEGTVSDYYSLRIYSDWSENFSTEVRLSRSDVTDVQGPVGGGEAQDGNPIPRLSVGVVGPSQNGVLSTGPGIFRSANALETQIDLARVTANWTIGDHDIKFGAEINDLSVFNLFAINATGTIFFRNLTDFQNGNAAPGFFSTVFGDTADNIAAGLVGGATIRATPTGDINEAAAQFNRRIYAIYAQDDWQVTDQLSVIGGVRVEWFDGSAPRTNPAFNTRYGFGNNFGFSQLDPIILPRLGFTYTFDDYEGLIRNSRLTGGVGVFSGGDPIVYFSNAFSNNGFSTGEGDTFDPTCAGFTNPDGSFNVLDAGGNFTGFPGCATQFASQQAAAGLADTQSTDPNFDVPTVVRANIGFSTEFGWGEGFFDNWQLQLDYIYSHFQDPINFVDLSQVVDPTQGLNGFTVDGRPIYVAIDPSNAGCALRLNGTGGTGLTYTGAFSDACRTRRDDEIQLTNGRSYDSHVFSFSMSKNFDRGVFTENGSVFVNFGYAFTDSNNFRNNNSSTATSSFDESAAFDRQNPANSTSNYETRHQFTFAVNFTEEFIDGYDTQLGMFFSARSGRPYSLTFDGGGVFNDSSSGNDNALIYIPTGVNDPNVSPLSVASEVAELVNFAQQWDCASDAAGTTIRRNTCREDWTYDMDIRISQELPGPGSWFGIAEDRFELFADIDNFLNMLDSSWNTFKTRGAFGDGQVVDLVDLDGIDAQGRYIISGFNPDIDQNVSSSASVWRIQIGARYEF